MKGSWGFTMIRLNKNLTIFISVLTSLIVGSLLYHIFNIFDLHTIISLETPILISNRYDDYEKNSVPTFLGYWHLIIMFLAGYIVYLLINSTAQNQIIKKLFAYYVIVSSTVILLPAHIIEQWLDNLIDSNGTFNFFDSLLIALVVFSFYLFWRSFQNKKSQFSGFKLWILATKLGNLNPKYIIEARNEDEAERVFNDYNLGTTKILSLTAFNGKLKILKFRRAQPGIIQHLF